jgi:hypothetical protein
VTTHETSGLLRRRHGIGVDGASGRRPLARPAVRAGRHAVRLPGAMPPPVLDRVVGGDGKTLKPADPRLPPIETRVIATPQRVPKAAQVARDAGLTPASSATPSHHGLAFTLRQE